MLLVEIVAIDLVLGKSLIPLSIVGVSGSRDPVNRMFGENTEPSSAIFIWQCVCECSEYPLPSALFQATFALFRHVKVHKMV